MSLGWCRVGSPSSGSSTARCDSLQRVLSADVPFRSETTHRLLSYPSELKEGIDAFGRHKAVRRVEFVCVMFGNPQAEDLKRIGVHLLSCLALGGMLDPLAAHGRSLVRASAPSAGPQGCVTGG